MHVTIDFETYSEAGFTYNKATRKWEGLLNASKKGLPTVGTAVYAKHPSTRILSLAYKLPDQEIELWFPNKPLPTRLFWYIDNPFESSIDAYFEAWNVSFERWIWEEVAVKRYDFPPMPIDKWRCAAAKSRAFALPGKLADAGKVLQTTAQKNKDGLRLINKFSCPHNPTLKDSRLRITPADDPEDAGHLYRYNMDDVAAEVEISENIPDLSKEELEFWQCDQEINHRGVQIDILSVLNCIHLVEQAHAKYNAELIKLTNGAVNASSEVARIKKWITNLITIEITSLDEEHIEELLNNPLLLPQIRRVLEIRQLIGSAAVKKLYAMLNQCTAEGRIHDLFIYHSARTGRAAGAGVQPQNLPRGEEGFDVEKALIIISSGSLEIVEDNYDNALNAVSNCLRGMFIAKEGYTLIGSDYSAIEAVVLAELAGEEWRQKVFRTHGKIYEMSASKLTCSSFNEILAYKEKTGKHHEARRLGKVAELASGYGGWVKAWKDFGADKFLSDEAIKNAILAWREASPAIVEFWGGQQKNYNTYYYGVEGAAIQAILYPGKTYFANNISFYLKNSILHCILPSKRELVYHNPQLAMSSMRPGTYELSYEGWNTNPKKGALGWIRQNTYGGKLVENITQAVARDILAHAIVNLEKRDYPVVLHVHDEIVAEMQLNTNWCLEEFEEIMSIMPSWAEGWPIKATGGWVNKRYCK